MELVQLDAVPVVIRTQYLPFFSRLGPYNPKLFDEIAYKDDEWYELWAHEASVAPVEIEPYLRFNKKRAANGDTWKGLYRLAVEEPSYIKKVLREVELKGPIEAKDLSDPQPRKNTGWGHRSKGQLALNWLYRIGEVGIRRGPNFEKQIEKIKIQTIEELKKDNRIFKSYQRPSKLSLEKEDAISKFLNEKRNWGLLDFDDQI